MSKVETGRNPELVKNCRSPESPVANARELTAGDVNLSIVNEIERSNFPVLDVSLFFIFTTPINICLYP